MFEVSEDDVAGLSDVDLRDVVARLAKAELRLQGCPVSSVTSGGNQDAADGGIDVRVECPSEIPKPDFVPRKSTGFQVKKPDMPAKAIAEEMRPDGILRDAIRALADCSGAYVIVSAQGSTADRSLQERLKAMRKAVQDHPTASQLCTEFYDRHRLAGWINEHPGVAAWVRSKAGRPLSGWSSVSDWNGYYASKPYLYDDRSFLVEQEAQKRNFLKITEGIERLREALRTPRQCIRLIGLSGLGKTRLVQALFEEGVGENCLDPSNAIYTDYTTPPAPTARDMARDLIARRKKAVLVVDNCNPTNHAELAALCSNEGSEISLITIEYDVRDDDPERTEVFRLESSSPALVTQWLKEEFPHVSELDRERIGVYSDGNFRVARALAETIRKGESLGSLRDRELFERIFWQRDLLDQQLLKAAQCLSLLYSVDGEDDSENGELAIMSAVSGLSVPYLYETLQQLKKRTIVQVRGRYRAILPQAIANGLAAPALEWISPQAIDNFCKNLTLRMRKSFSRRLGLLDGSEDAQKIVSRLLQATGSFGDLFATKEDFVIVSNFAPAAPEAVLDRLQDVFVGSNGTIPAQEWSNYQEWILLIRQIGYDARFFDAAVFLLARLYAAKPKKCNEEWIRARFEEFFHIHLSGTNATPEQRRAAVRRFASSKNPNLRPCRDIAIKAILKTRYFISSDRHDFGARSRDWGWHPKDEREASDWFEKGIELAIEAMPEEDARVQVANGVRALWRLPNCRATFDRVATVFLKRGPWIEGWINLRVALKFDGKKLSDSVREELKRLIDRVKPTDLLNQARAIVINRRPDGGGYDIEDGEDYDDDGVKPRERADRMAQKIGRALAQDAEVRAQLLSELMIAPHVTRALNFASGLVEGATDLCAMWDELATTAEHSGTTSSNAHQILAGFLLAARKHDESFAISALESTLKNPKLVTFFPRLQGRLGLDANGVDRVRKALKEGLITTSNLNELTGHGIRMAPPDSLVVLLKEIRELPNGVEAALNILQTYLCIYSDEHREPSTELLSIGCDLLVKTRFQRNELNGTHSILDYDVQSVILKCLGPQREHAAKQVCQNLHWSLSRGTISTHDVEQTLEALFKTNPHVALDAFLLPPPNTTAKQALELSFYATYPIEELDHAILIKWANQDSAIRYSLLGKHIDLFQQVGGNRIEEKLSPLFLALLAAAPDKLAFLGDFLERLHGQGGTGSLIESGISRRALLLNSLNKLDAETGRWINDGAVQLDIWHEQLRKSERKVEESFE